MRARSSRYGGREEASQIGRHGAVFNHHGFLNNETLEYIDLRMQDPVIEMVRSARGSYEPSGLVAIQRRG